MFREEIWVSLNELLNAARVDRSRDPFWCLGGDNPTEADVTLFAFVSSILAGTSCPESSALLRSLPAIMNYTDLIHQAFFSDYGATIPSQVSSAAQHAAMISTKL
ncbi:hypothetical protein AAFC00_001535 [Neodothiora populina]|uniref:Metaxin glutathione S-transferase domain-containing protein n=1 Tax=Neodothiora populina TaxID=2781224 RepID=A0ABR3PQB2_9PEZI